MTDHLAILWPSCLSNFKVIRDLKISIMCLLMLVENKWHITTLLFHCHIWPHHIRTTQRSTIVGPLGDLGFSTYDSTVRVPDGMSSLVQVMTWCFTAPHYYLNQWFHWNIGNLFKGWKSIDFICWVLVLKWVQLFDSLRWVQLFDSL